MSYTDYSFYIPNNDGSEHIIFNATAGARGLIFEGILDTDSTSLSYNEWIFTITDSSDPTFKRSFVLHINTLYYYNDIDLLLYIKSSENIDNNDLSTIQFNILIPVSEE